MKKYATLVIVGIAIGGLIVLVVQFMPAFDSGPSVDRFRNVPPMEGPDITNEMTSLLSGNAPGSQGLPLPGDPGPVDGLPEGVIISREVNSLDHALVADHFQAALLLQPRQLLAAPQVKPLVQLLGKLLPGDLLEMVQLDPAAFESIIVLIDSLPASPTPVETSPPSAVQADQGEGPARDSQDPKEEEAATAQEPLAPVSMEMAVIVKLAEGDAAEVATALSQVIPGLWKEEEIEGKPGRVNALPLPSPMPTGIIIFDDRTLVVSSPATIAKMLAATGTSPLARRLATIDLLDDVVLVATPGVLPDEAMAGTDLVQLNPLAMLQGLPDQLQVASIAIRLSSDPLLQVELDARDDASAKSAHGAIKSTLNLVRVLAEAQKDQFAENPVSPDGYLESMELIAVLLNTCSLGRHDRVTVASVSLNGEIISSLGSLLPQLLEPGEAEEPPGDSERP